MNKKEMVRERLEALKDIGITTIDDLLTIVNFLPGGEEEYTFESRSSKESFSIEKESDFSLETRVKKVLHRLGMPSHVKGYQFTVDAILLVLRDIEALDGITKIIYPTVAKKHHSKSPRVERAIRHAVEVTWDRGDIDVLAEMFGNSISPTKGKPTNLEFIAMIADHIRMGGE